MPPKISRNYNRGLFDYTPEEYGTLLDKGVVDERWKATSMAILRCVMCKIARREPIAVPPLEKCVGLSKHEIRYVLQQLIDDGFMLKSDNKLPDYERRGSGDLPVIYEVDQQSDFDTVAQSFLTSDACSRERDGSRTD